MPIFWYLGKISNFVNETLLADPDQFLGMQEIEIYHKLKFVKRKTEWLGGRLALKALVRASDLRFKYTKNEDIEILAMDNGAPWLKIGGASSATGSISLSHSNGYIFCAYSTEDVPIGVDLEVIESRNKDFISDYFTKNEVEQISKLDQYKKILYVNLIWSGKESVLKALNSGLRVDTRSVEIQLHTLIGQQNAWSNLGIASSLITKNSLSLVWRREGDFVLTACIPQGSRVDLKQLTI